jgi:putative hemolysin
LDSIPYDSIILLGALLIFSAYFSASETSITSVNKIRLRNQAESNNAKAIRALRITENFDQGLSTILIGNNIVNIAMAAIATKLATDFFGNQGSTVVISTIIVTVMVLVFGEILPKSLAKQYSEKYLFFISSSLILIMKVFYPVTWLFVQLKEGINKLIGSQPNEPTVTDEDVKAMVQIGEEEGTFLSQEKELLHSALAFDDIVVNDILTPRPDVVAISLNSSIDDIKNIFIQEQYSRLPIYDESIDNIVGTISHRDFFAMYVQQGDFKITEIIRKPHFVIGTVKISNLLRELQKHKVHLAIVLDEYGGTVGIISIEDIIEEIVGEIWDEHDESETLIEIVGEDKVRLDGRISIEVLRESLNISLHESSSNTLGGWISENLGYLPKKSEVMEYHNYTFIIEEVKNRRIQKVVVKSVDSSSFSFTA